MTDQAVEGWFDDAERKGAPSAKLRDKGDWVKGEVVDQFTIDYVPFGKTEPLRDERTNEIVKQLVIVLQTDKRNWDGVSKIPTDGDDKPKPAEVDDGKRAVYVRKYTNIYGAFGEALKAAAEKAGHKVQVQNGGVLGVQVYDLQDVGKGNPLKLHRIKYEPPAPTSDGDGFFEGSSTGTSEQASQPAQQSAPAQDPWSGATTQEDPPF